MDTHGNITAREGLDRCIECGCKYWENDQCIDCGMLIEIHHLRVLAARMRYLNEVRLNTILTTWEASMGIRAHTLDLVETNRKYREMGVIQ